MRVLAGGQHIRETDTCGLQALTKMAPVAIVRPSPCRAYALIFPQVGIATRLPSGTHSTSDFDHDTFFKFLLDKGESYERVPKDRFNIDA